MSAWDKIKDNWPQLTVLVVILLALVGTWAEVRMAGVADKVVKNDASKLYIQKMIDDRLTGVPTDARLATMDGRIDVNEAGVKTGSERDDRLESKIERIVDILLED